ncbi:juvenile hormone acid O-methyltransferase isoform X2 [Leptinotarsa decemlineata]|uniref:juvenile hormone acid O-methyltransferase isoform X2 n=1 Tax=Leptinotarsa decemlineata TaxID=7539 RepID=UPI003D306635
MTSWWTTAFLRFTPCNWALFRGVNNAFFSKVNKHAQGVNRNIMEKYQSLLTWKENESILDIGSGLGNTVKYILFPHVPKTFKELICSDISREMVDFARTNFQDPKVSHLQLDISTENLPCDLENRFDHVFSFFCFHWIQKPEQAMKNIHKMLKPGGEMFITFMERNPFDQPYKNLSKYEKWAKYGHEFFISPFHHSNNSYDAWKDAVQKSAPFEDCIFSLDETHFLYDDEKDFEDTWTAVNPIFNSIPDEDREEYQRDHMAELKGHPNNFIPVEIDKQQQFKTEFNVMTIFGKKPYTKSSMI